MAQIVTYHWVGIKKVEVPDGCPTDDLGTMQLWLAENDVEEVVVKEDSRDFEIVDVEEDDY